MPNLCPHEQRPGVTVCLHCRHEAHEAERARRNAMLAKIGVASLGIGAVVAIGFASVGALEGSPPSPARARATPAATLVASRPSPAPVRLAAMTIDSAAGAVAAAPVAATPVATTPARPPLAPALPEGRTELGEPGVYAVRAGDTVTVFFDTPATRTRRPEKFERVVRATLPAVYGATSPAASALLSALPAGLSAASDLLTDLPARGIRLPLDGKRGVTLWPQTRPGEDGPLVVGYRVVGG